MRPELRKRIIAFNKQSAQRKEKSEDLDVLVAEILALPPGQLKKILTDDVLAVLAKYGYTDE